MARKRGRAIKSVRAGRMWNLVAIRGGVAIDEDYTTSQISNCKINHSASAKNQQKYSYARRPAFRSLAKKTPQSALAERVGCLFATIEKIESEELRSSTQIAELLANALEIPTAERKLFLKVARRIKSDVGLASVSLIPFPHPKTTQPIPPTPIIGPEGAVVRSPCAYDSKIRPARVDNLEHRLAQLPVTAELVAEILQRLPAMPAAGWLTLILFHPAATQGTKQRADQLLEKCKQRVPPNALSLEDAVTGILEG